MSGTEKSKNLAAVTTGEVWPRYQCVGGPHDGLIVSIERQARNVILIGPDDRAHEYLDLSVSKLSPVLASTTAIGTELGTCDRKLEYSGWLTAKELEYVKSLAAR